MAGSGQEKRRLLWAGVLCLFLPTLPFASPDDEVQQREQELKSIQQRIGKLKSDLKSQQAQQKDLQQELRATEQQIGDTARKLRVLEGSLSRQRQKLSQLEKSRSLQQSHLGQQRLSLEHQIRSAYAMGRQERLKILLNQQDPSVVSRVMVYYDYFNRARAQRISAIHQALEALQQTQLEIQQEEQRLSLLQQRELGEQRKLEATRELRQQVVAALDARIRQSGSELSGLQQDEQQLQGLVQQLQQKVMRQLEGVDQKPFPKLRGKLSWPAKGKLAARFGTTKAGSLKWDGVIINAPEGREVRAVHHGRVAFADWLRGFGLMIIIDHGDGYLTLYGHNQSLFKETGEWVEPGEAVALVGSSGGKSNSGLYFGIRYNGKPVNPTKWCQATRGNRVGQLQRQDSAGQVARQVSPESEDQV
jgi:septal ring factor EnvC (AmiA/AmiB activator)